LEDLASSIFRVKHVVPVKGHGRRFFPEEVMKASHSKHKGMKEGPL
jgi:hypothetical protein